MNLTLLSQTYKELKLDAFLGIMNTEACSYVYIKHQIFEQLEYL